MSFYNLLFGVNKSAPVLMATLGLTPADVPRFRDCFINGDKIVIHTRTGGGNREYYDEPNEENTEGPWNSTLRDNAFYISDKDDDFDSTYANFFFRFPDAYADDLKVLADKDESHTPSKKWQALFERMKSA